MTYLFTLTSFISRRQKLEKGKLRRLYFIWISREIDTFHWFLELLHEFYNEVGALFSLDNFFILS